MKKIEKKWEDEKTSEIVDFTRKQLPYMELNIGWPEILWKCLVMILGVGLRVQ